MRYKFWHWIWRLSERKMFQISINIHTPCPVCGKIAHQELVDLRSRVIEQRIELHRMNLRINIKGLDPDIEFKTETKD